MSLIRRVFIIICFAFAACAVEKGSLSPHSGSCGDKVSWDYNPNTFTITIQGTGAMTDYSDSEFVPWKEFRASIKNATIQKGVTSVGAFSFSYCVSLITVTLPPGIKSIGNKSFYRCFDLPSITIPAGVESIGRSAFNGCTSFTSISLPASIKSIGQYAFQKCRNLASITFPSKSVVKTIEFSTFSGCSTLRSVTIPSSVTTIEDHAFNNCVSLISISIPETVTSIGASCFSYCSSLTNVTLPPLLKTIPTNAFSLCTSLESITIPPSVGAIESYAFVECLSLKNVVFPGVKRIGSGAFSGCSSLTNISIPNGVEKIGASAFSECNLTTVNIPANVKSVGNGVFACCHNLVSITVDKGNENFESINDVLFQRKDDGLTLLQYPCGREGVYVVPDNTTSIKRNSFEGSQKITSIIIPASVTLIENCSFRSCTRLTSINVKSGGSKYKSIDGVLFDQAGSTLIQYPCGKSESYSITGEVKTIREKAFAGCSNLKNVTISSGVETIENNAFQDCTRLSSVRIPSSVTSIGSCPFLACSELASINVDGENPSYSDIDGVLFTRDKTKLIQYPCAHGNSYTIPENVTTICDSAFDKCYSFSSITIPATVTTIETVAFNGVNLAYVNFLGLNEPKCVDESSTFGVVDVVCVPLNYNSTKFCSRYQVKVDSCEEFVRQQNQCYEVLEWQEEITVKKRANATLWEKQTNNCFEYQCSNTSGRISWSKCNTTSDGVHRICFENECRTESEILKDQEKWAIELDVNIPVNDFDMVNFTLLLGNKTGIDDLSIGTEALETTGGIVRIVVYVESKEEADIIAKIAEECSHNEED